MKLFKKLFNHEYKELQKFEAIADEVMALDEEYSKLSDKKLKAKTKEFKERLENGETLEDIKVEAFATAREAAYRVIGEKPYRVQIIGGLAIHYGNIAEMKTGEGKTLTSTMPAYLNALSGEGVHIITVNEYLAQRDANWMGEIYRFLGLTVGINFRELTPSEKKEAYNCDILYSTNNEIGFDYLRDNMVVKADDRVARPYNFAIIDEVDSVLIDEARTPLIISGGHMKSANLYMQTDKFAKSLKENEGYTYDEKTKSVSLDQTGIEKAEKTFKVDNLYDINNTNLVHFINQALKANYAMKLDVDYVVNDGEIVIVDPFTGRLMKGRNYSDGLHQAIEAKEGVQINEETKTLATITFQNLFRMYKKLSGMTGTAKTEEEEFRDIYNMYVIVIPTNKPVARKDYGDLLFATKEGKFKAIVNEIKERHAIGQPVLVGTVAVETSELISQKLKKEKVPHEVLNAKNHAREAEIIAKAGEKGSVTIATNMAGRGTDIKLTDEVKELGGLFVIGTERHESRRIDNQLRGRSGRQGDPGESRFYISLEDDLMRLFGSEKMIKVVDALGLEEDEVIEHNILSKAIENAQKKVEGNNFAIRKHLFEYDKVMNEQREIIYEERRKVLDGENLRDSIINMIRSVIGRSIELYTRESEFPEEWDIANLNEYLLPIFHKSSVILSEDDKQSLKKEDLLERLFNEAKSIYEAKENEFGQEQMREIERIVTLKIVDRHWMDHIDNMEQMRQGISLRAYAQRDPLVEYKFLSYDMFEDMSDNIQLDTIRGLFNVRIETPPEREQVAKETSTNIEASEKKPIQRKSAKIGRNDPCPCGSGKKYKQCCGKNI